VLFGVSVTDQATSSAVATLFAGNGSVLDTGMPRDARPPVRRAAL
jgi:hypothetical protein